MIDSRAKRRTTRRAAPRLASHLGGRRAAWLPRDPLPSLLSAGDPALLWRVRRDLLEERPDPTPLLDLPALRRILGRQQSDGRFRHPAGVKGRGVDYDQYQTYKTLLEVVAKYSLTRRHPGVARASEFLFAHQTDGGDFRGIYGAQYTPTYTSAILAVLVEAGYGGDPRVARGFDWLLSMRQKDGGWAIPLRTTAAGRSFTRALQLGVAIEPDRDRPSSHLVTGLALRAFASHPRWRRSLALRPAVALLANRMFFPDVYVDRRAAAYWGKLVYPFQWTDVLSATDALTRLGVGREHPQVRAALSWLVEVQNHDGTWRCGFAHNPESHADLWVTYAAACLFKRLSSKADTA